MWGGGDPHGPSAGIGTGAVAAEHSTEVPPEVKTELPGGPAISLLGTELKEVKSRPGRGTCTLCSLQHDSQWPRRKQAARPPWMSKDGAVRMRAAERGSALGREGLLPAAAMRMDLEGLTPSERSQRTANTG